MKNRRPTLDFTRRFMLWFGASIVLVAFIYIFCITFIPVPAANAKFVDIILGFLIGTMFGTVINFYFGSSNSSNEKDKMIQQIKVENKDQAEGLQEDAEKVDDETDLKPPQKG